MEKSITFGGNMRLKFLAIIAGVSFFGFSDPQLVDIKHMGVRFYLDPDYRQQNFGVAEIQFQMTQEGMPVFKERFEWIS